MIKIVDTYEKIHTLFDNGKFNYDVIGGKNDFRRLRKRQK